MSKKYTSGATGCYGRPCDCSSTNDSCNVPLKKDDTGCHNFININNPAFLGEIVEMGCLQTPIPPDKKVVVDTFQGYPDSLIIPSQCAQPSKNSSVALLGSYGDIVQYCHEDYDYNLRFTSSDRLPAPDSGGISNNADKTILGEGYDPINYDILPQVHHLVRAQEWQGKVQEDMFLEDNTNDYLIYDDNTGQIIHGTTAGVLSKVKKTVKRAAKKVVKVVKKISPVLGVKEVLDEKKEAEKKMKEAEKAEKEKIAEMEAQFAIDKKEHDKKIVAFEELNKKLDEQQAIVDMLQAEADKRLVAEKEILNHAVAKELQAFEQELNQNIVAYIQAREARLSLYSVAAEQIGK
jgi:hypothetical protein